MRIYHRTSLNAAKSILARRRLYANARASGPINWGPFFFLYGEPENEIPTGAGFHEATLHFECRLPVHYDRSAAIIDGPRQFVERFLGHLIVEYNPCRSDQFRQCRIIPPAPDSLRFVGYSGALLPWTRFTWNRWIREGRTVSVELHSSM